MHQIIIDRAIARIECTPEEKASACKQYYEQNQLTDETQLQAWLARYGMSLEQLEALTTRTLRIEKFKQATWRHKLESYFLSRKAQLDKVVYSLMRLKDVGIAEELYFRIQEHEQSFAELAHEYTQGPEAETGGLRGPVELSNVHPTLARMLSVSQRGQLWPPFRLGEWLVIVRLEKLLPAQLDELMRRRLMNELFENWLREQIQQVGPLRSVQS